MKSAMRFLETGLPWVALDHFLSRRRQKVKMPPLEDEVTLPWGKLPEQVCFACSSKHAKGLRLRFFETKKGGLATRWTSTEGYENYPGMIHGGISSLILDELLGQVVFNERGHLTVSTNANTKWMKPVNVGERLSAWARIEASYGQFFRLKGYLFNENGDVAVEMKGLHFAPTLRHFKKLTGSSDVPKAAEEWFYGNQAPIPSRP